MHKHIRFFLALCVLITATALSAKEVTEKDLYGRWYSETRMQMTDENENLVEVRLCGTSEYFRNHMSNGQAELKASFSSEEDENTFDVEITWFYRGSSEWQIIDQSLLEKIVDVKIGIKDMKVSINGSPVENEATLKDIRDRFEGINQLFYAGLTSDARIVSHNKDLFVTEELQDDGQNRRMEYHRTTKIIEGCR